MGDAEGAGRRDPVPRQRRGKRRHRRIVAGEREGLEARRGLCTLFASPIGVIF